MRGLFLRIIIVLGLTATALAQPPQPLSANRPTGTHSGPSGTDDTAAVVAGTAISTKQVDEKLGGRLIQLRTQEYRLRKGVLDELVTAALLDKEAAARRITTAELVASEIDAKAKPVTQEEAVAVLDSARDRMGMMSEAEAIKSITSGMQRQRVAQRRAEFAATLMAKHGVQFLLEPPRVKLVPPPGPSIGPADAVVTIVEFSDFQCPYCGRGAKTVKEVVDKYKGKVRLVFQDFPLPIHADAPKAAEAAACAGDQGKFWEMHDEMFQKQDRLKVVDLKRYAVGLGLDAQAFNTCLDSGQHAADWKRTKALGEYYGVSGTPGFFINGVPISGAAPLQEFTLIIDDELGRAAKVTTAATRNAPRERQP